jgi:PilZ domain
MSSELSGFQSDRRTAPRYRVHSFCVLETPDGPMGCRLKDVSGSGAFLETNGRPVLGTPVTLRHPVAGLIDGTVSRHATEGIALNFPVGRDSVTYALRVIAADMTEGQPAQALA